MLRHGSASCSSAATWCRATSSVHRCPRRTSPSGWTHRRCLASTRLPLENCHNCHLVCRQTRDEKAGEIQLARGPRGQQPDRISHMKFGAALPITAISDPVAVRDYAQTLDDAGFDVLTTAGHVLAVPAERYTD